ncbi:MAG TPA: hypothetical protein VGJ83_07410 [Gemmatimonadales bacterium]|jgi:hypothetical protein
MRGAIWLTILLTACGGGGAVRTRSDDTLSLGLAPRDSTDSTLLAPRVVTGPTVIVFWLPAADTLSAEDQSSALDDMTYYTERIVPVLERDSIKLLPTNAETVYVALPNRQRRTILLSGLDYPFGYVIVEPGGTERILAGVYADDELLDEIRAYFDLEDDSTATKPRITT